jgi:hypothetical protein
MAFDYQKLFGSNFSNAQITISGIPTPTGITQDIIGIITSELNFGSGNSWNTPLESAQQSSLSETVQGGGAVLSNLLSGTRFKDLVKPFTLRTIQQSVKIWNGSDLPVFTVKLIFVALAEDDDVRENVAQLMQSVAPPTASFGSTFLTPPLGYQPSGLKASGVISVAIGSWFEGHNFVMNNVNFTFSAETIASGNPLYAEGTISFTPYRIISASELSGYITV